MERNDESDTKYSSNICAEGWNWNLFDFALKFCNKLFLEFFAQGVNDDDDDDGRYTTVAVASSSVQYPFTLSMLMMMKTLSIQILNSLCIPHSLGVANPEQNEQEQPLSLPLISICANERNQNIINFQVRNNLTKFLLLLNVARGGDTMPMAFNCLLIHLIGMNGWMDGGDDGGGSGGGDDVEWNYYTYENNNNDNNNKRVAFWFTWHLSVSVPLRQNK